MKSTTLLTVLFWLVTNSVPAQDSKEYIQFKLSSSFSDNILAKLRKEKFFDQYEFNADINPFYMTGDFNGDNRPDYAFAISEKANGKKGILIANSYTTYTVLGAGKMFPDRNRDDLSYMEVCRVHSQSEKVEMGIDETEPPTLKGDAILCIKPEASSWLIYWDGSRYRVYWQGD